MAVNYCPYCGQKASTYKLSMHDLSHDVIHYVTHADKSIFSLIRQLAHQPGIVAREYIAGRRQRYIKPLNFFLIVAGILVFVTSLFYTPNDNSSRQIETSASRVDNPQQKQRMLAMAARMKVVNKITGKYSNFINMAATPLLAFMFWIFYRRKYNYIESLVANMYFTGFITLGYGLIIVPLQNLIPNVGMYLIGVFFLFEFFYRGYAFYQLDGVNSTRARLKGYGVSLFISLLWFTLTFSLISYYIRYGF